MTHDLKAEELEAALPTPEDAGDLVVQSQSLRHSLALPKASRFLGAIFSQLLETSLKLIELSLAAVSGKSSVARRRLGC